MNYPDSHTDGLIIGFDAKRIVRNGTGLGSYARTLVNDLAPLMDNSQLRLYTPDMGREELASQISSRDNLEFVLPHPTPLLGNLGKSWWRSRGIVSQLRADGVGLFHGLTGELPIGVRRAAIPSVVTIHDLIFLRHPEFYPRIDAWLYARKFYATMREATRIIAISECTKRDILAYSNFPEERIDLIYQSCGIRFSGEATESELQRVKQKYRLPEQYVLNVGTIEARKNVLLAVKALQYLPEEVGLVVVGRATAYSRKVEAYIEKHRLGHRVLMLHGVPNDDLAAIYQMARVFVYPSHYEGFGIPIIEAIQSGLPVVAATGSCLEEAGGRDSLYVDPHDEKAMAEAIDALRTDSDRRRESIGRSRQYVTRFENRSVAQQVIECYQKTMEG